MKYYHLGIVFDRNYFPLFSKPVRNFLLLNNICMTVYLYKESGFKNKKMISYFWKLFLEMHHYRLMRGYLHIVKLTIYKPLDRFLKFINITCFAFSFILLIFKQYFILYDFLSCLWLFSLVFVIFLLFLNYLAPSPSTELRELTGQDIRLKEYLNSWFKATKVNLLKIYPFLEEKDLPDSFVETKNAKILVYLENAEFSNKILNEQELAIVNKVNQRFIGWYKFELQLGCIDIATSLYTPKDKY